MIASSDSSIGFGHEESSLVIQSLSQFKMYSTSQMKSIFSVFIVLGIS